MTENEGVGASMGSQSEDRREQGKVAEGSLARLAKGPAAKYVGFALLLAWHYALWFVPHVFVQTELLDERGDDLGLVLHLEAGGISHLSSNLSPMD